MKLENLKSRESKRAGGKLNNWYKFAYAKTPMSMRVNSEDGNDYQVVIKGIIEGDGNWPDGEALRTSLIVNLDESNNTVETLNTIYTLGNKHPEFDERWDKSVQALVPWVELDIPEFKIDLEHCTDVPVMLSYKKHKQVNTTIEEAPWCGSYSTVDHPSFAALRKHLKACGLIYMEESWINGDRVLKPFKLNDILFNEGDQFVCASAMKYHLEVETEDEQENN